ncbi:MULTISPECIES: acyl-CoA-binding protein [unclassified Streptomyces]|uniref:acyl-CoA-binding protein n=1 Tax=unclassified Streptomyces TaxID=2593676 RepID=UPI003402809C
MSVGLDNPEFKQLAEDVKNVSSKPGNDTLLELYAYFKQATVGDNTTDAPGMMDFTGKAKWNAWNNLAGMTQTDATQKYIDVAKDVIAKH